MAANAACNISACDGAPSETPTSAPTLAPTPAPSVPPTPGPTATPAPSFVPTSTEPTVSPFPTLAPSRTFAPSWTRVSKGELCEAYNVSFERGALGHDAERSEVRSNLL